VFVRERERWVRRRLGHPRRVHRGFLHFCALGGGSMRVGEREDRSGELGTGSNERAAMLLATAPRLSFEGVRPRGHRVWGGAPVALRYGPFNVYERHGVLAGVLRGRVRYLAVYNRSAIRTKRALVSYLRRAG
jgi:hypothetical protein